MVSVDSAEIRKSKESPELKASIVGLVFLHNAECLYKLGKYREALLNLELLTGIRQYTDSEYSKQLDRSYPRFPRIKDSNIVDDAQVLKALSIMKLAEAIPAKNGRMRKYREGVLELVNTFRFFPYLEYGVSMNKVSEALIRAVREENEAQLQAITGQFQNSFFKAHDWPARN
jgi:hypothetical protein